MGNIIKGTEPSDGNIELSSLDVLETHPDPQVRAASQTLINVNVRRGKILTLVKEALQQLRLDMKYLMFDLEATRRERDDYRQQIEEALFLFL